jgi:hypothetical protein
MKKFWEAVGKYAVKVAVYALGHPDQVVAVVKAVKR